MSASTTGYAPATSVSRQTTVTGAMEVTRDRLGELEARVNNLATYIIGAKPTTSLEPEVNKIYPVPNGLIETVAELNSRLCRLNERLTEIENNLQG